MFIKAITPDVMNPSIGKIFGKKGKDKKTLSF